MGARKLALVSALFPLGLMLAAAPASASAPQTYVVGVDGIGPKNHNFEFVDYFPRALTVHQGDVIDFKWSLTPDGLHTATLLPSGQAPPGLVVPDETEGVQFNPSVLAPSDFTCGGAVNPCDYNGSRIVSSGALPTVPGIDFFAKIDTAPGSTVNLICEIHPGMAATIKVVDNGTRTPSPAWVAAKGRAQLRSDIHGALETIEDLNGSLVKENPDGTHTVTLIAGAATQHVEIAEMLPSKLRIQVGDTVKFITKTLKDPHTVTFPQGHGSDAVDPLVPACEGSPADTAPPCGSPPLQELHLVPQPQGPTVISSPGTVASSGVIATFGPFPDRYSFTFPNAGTFAYQCRIHDHMTGTIIVNSAGESD